jgi:hypothetical protein
MSGEQQDAILGRLVRQNRECQSEIGALEAELARFSDSLRDLALTLSGVMNPKTGPVTSIDKALAAVSMMPGQKEMMDTLEELRTARDRRVELKRQLDQMSG